jgi:hypothetical protein
MGYLLYPSIVPGAPGYLAGLAAECTKTPRFSVEVQTASSGSEVRIGYWQEPLWKWVINYNLLRDGFRNGVAYDELRRIVGLFLASNGSLTGFQLKDPDDNCVFRQQINGNGAFGVTDGVTSAFTLKRSYGQNDIYANGYVGIEAIGFLDLNPPGLQSTQSAFNLYIDTSATPVSTSDPTWGYTLNTSAPKNQQIVFNSTPPAGHLMSCDMFYNYYARFEADSMDFDKFMADLWELKKVTLVSLRAGS